MAEKAARSHVQVTPAPQLRCLAPCDDAPAWRSLVAGRLRGAVTSIYHHTLLERFLHREHVQASPDGRCVPLTIDPDQALVDPRRGRAFVSNDIRTSRYTLWDFIPKQLVFQFSRVGNFYFLCVGVPQTIPGLSTTGSYTTILPLLLFVLLTIIKEGFDDYKRYRLDKVENANFATVLGRVDRYAAKLDRDSSWGRWNFRGTRTRARPRPTPDDEYQGIRWVPARWSHVKVGDIIRLSRDEPVPADVILLHSEGENDLAYVETMALDGETNLKCKHVSHALKGCDSIRGLSRCNAEFVAEDPNADLYGFDGRLMVDGIAVPLTVNEVLYRGSVLRNTPSVIGIVINTGEECKIRMNANRHPKAKRPALERVVNRVVVTLATYVVVLSVGVSMGYVNWHNSYAVHAWYLNGAGVPFYQIIIAFIIMFNNVVPLALYVSLEIVKIGQLLMLNSDMEMYDQATDTPARCNTNTILENLGQIGYVFSDKTGTLTDNVMEFRKISVAGTVWLHEMDLQPRASNLSELDAKRDATSGADMSWHKAGRINAALPPKTESNFEAAPMSPALTTGRRSSSHWRSLARPDHVQPSLNTADLTEYVKLRPHAALSRRVREYMMAMALCHTCLPENRDGKVEFQASSPDELALVRAAQQLGYSVVHRNSQSITLQLAQSDQDEGRDGLMMFEILDVIEFSSARKRMSIVVRYPDGRISVICKGADSAILPRLKMSSLAMQKASEVRQSAEVEHEMFRRSQQLELRNSFGGRSSLTIRRNPGVSRESATIHRPHVNRSQSFEVNKWLRRSDEVPRLSPTPRGVSMDGLGSGQYVNSAALPRPPLPDHLAFLDYALVGNDAEIFTNCFKHLDSFATEGLRTLIYAQKFISEREYEAWKKTYAAATTSLFNRQDLIEEAGDQIEQSFELVGASAIEDKLQQGVPETIEKLRRANMKIWMLTGDKRETAINIAHSARICRPGSDLYILDATKGGLESQLESLSEDLRAGSVHSVVVIDGQTLGVVEKCPKLTTQFYQIMIEVDSVICCRASPSQKALLVRTVRSRLRRLKGKERRGLTLAIGDGANDLAMIQASHVGVGISGKEGLQAARVADYAIAQFRFLQRLLLVHGRWNYVRTAKFILCTFWKEMFFYLPTAQYQRYNGYTGTSLYQSTSLTVFNTLFTSLCVICMGIWEQDLRAETLLALPELYVYGQRNMGLNLGKYAAWMLVAAIEGVIVWYGVWAGYGWKADTLHDEGLYALGQLAFTIGVLWINWKLFILETHYKSAIVLGSFFLTTGGWFAWTAFLNGVYALGPSGAYNIRDTFTQAWGRDPTWWLTMIVVLGIMGFLELAAKTLKRNLTIWGLWNWPPWRQRRRYGNNVEEWGLGFWQEMEQDPVVWERFKSMARDEDPDDLDDGDVQVDRSRA